ncbi:MAG: glycosyltransferase family 1 protein [Planctomycetota bacterium]|nr:MAG: glycosyltransferase family 1 protein [Planctomycetota bacterium]
MSAHITHATEPPQRVVYLVAGAADTICGSCIRDNRLAAALRAQGRDVILAPLYTPIRTDEDDVSEPRVYFGGLNVYLQHKYELFRRTPRFVNRWLNSPALLRGVGRLATNTRPDQLGALTLSVLRGSDGPLARELDALVDALCELRPQLVNLPNLMFAGLAPRLREHLGVPTVCTLSGEDAFVERLPQPYAEQVRSAIRRNAAAIDLFLATSAYYADHCVRRFGLPGDRVRHVRLGIRQHDCARDGEPAQPPFVVAFLGRICPDKGLAELADAVIKLRNEGRRIRLLAAGYLHDAERGYLRSVENRFHEAGFAEGFEYLGEVSRRDKLALLRRAHVFSMPSVFPEAKGLPVIEALAVGVPVVQPARGSFVEIVNDTGGGLLYDPDQPDALPAAIARVMDDDDLRARLGAQGRERVRHEWTDHRMADETWTLYERLMAEHGAQHERT